VCDGCSPPPTATITTAHASRSHSWSSMFGVVGAQARKMGGQWARSAGKDDIMDCDRWEVENTVRSRAASGKGGVSWGVGCGCGLGNGCDVGCGGGCVGGVLQCLAR
jgi:hypothetical protein